MAIIRKSRALSGIPLATVLSLMPFLSPDASAQVRFQVDTNGTLTTNLAAYYKLEDTTDFWRSNNLTNTNSVAFSAGKVGNAADFGAGNTNKYLSIGSNLGITGANAPMAMAGWVKFYSNPADGVNYTLLEQQNGTTNNRNFLWYANNAGTTQLIASRQATGSGGNEAVYNVDLNDSAWHFVIWNYDGSSLSLYLDGSQVATTPVLYGAGAAPAADEVDIGDFYDSGNSLHQHFASAEIDEVGFWAKNLSNQEIADLYNGGSGQTMVQTGVEPTPPSTYGGGGQTSQNGFTNEPINTATGNYFMSHADLVVPGKGLSFNFTRAYNSLDPYSGPIGAGWTHSFNVFLTASSSSVTVKEADGHTATFTPTSGGNYTASTPGVFDTLFQNADGTYTLTRKNQTHFNFTATGQLTTIVDRNGNSQTLTYNSSGSLASILDSSGRPFIFASDTNGRITSVSDPIGRIWQYTYDTNGNLVSVKDAAGGTTQYAYDTNHRMTSATDQRGVTFLQNTFDSNGRVINQRNARGFSTTLAYGSPAPGTTTFTDPLGNATQHVYDGNLRLIQAVDANGGVVSYAYDANNDRTSVTNQNGKNTNFTYDGNGNTTTITDPIGKLTAFTYDPNNNLLSATNPKGSATNFSFDANGNLITIKDALGDTTTFAYNGGLLSSKADARGNTTTFSYNSAGDLVKVVDALGNATSLAYDGVSRLISVTDAKGHTATSSYDSLSRIVSVTDALGDQTQFAYDAVNNVLKVIDANGNPTGYSYDFTNNLALVTDAVGNVTHYAYDANNNRTGVTNAKGNATLYGFDGLNRLNRITDPLSFVTSYQYDAVGNVLSTTDADGKTNQFSYDPLNRIIIIGYADGTNVAYSYDANGNRLSMADSHGATAYTYDALDRMTSVTQPGGKTVQYGYDPVGNRTLLTYPDGKTVSYAYDRLNRLTGATDWLGKRTNYSYDSVSNLLQTQYPNRAGITFAYDAANRLTQVVNSAFGIPLLGINYTLDRVGNRLSLTADGVKTAFAYDPLNELVSTQLGPVKTTWTYDQVGNRVTQVGPTGATAYAYDADDRLLSAGTASFTYDANGNRLTKTVGSNAQSFAYDAANRLVSVSGPGVNSTFGYDGDGNRVTQATMAGTYAYVNDINTPLPAVLSEQGPDGSLTYAYGMGLIEEYSAAFNYFYHFDGLGSVVALTDAHGLPAAAYAYDSWGNTLLAPPGALGERNKFRFTGEAIDPGTGLYYLRARYYDPSVGKFLVQDQSMGINSFPLTSNRYAYALNNPLNYSDPSGFSANAPGQQNSVQAVNVQLTASLASFLSDSNATTILQSLGKTALSAGLRFASTLIGLVQAKVQQLQLQAAINVPNLARRAVDYYETGAFTPMQSIRTALTDQNYGFSGLSADQLSQIEGLFNQDLREDGYTPASF